MILLYGPTFAVAVERGIDFFVWMRKGWDFLMLDLALCHITDLKYRS